MKFVEELPVTTRTHISEEMLKELRETLGRWAEIARYPRARKNTAYSRGTQFTARHSDIKYTVRTVGDESILFMRAVSL